MTETKRLAPATIHSILVHLLFVGFLFLLEFISTLNLFSAQKPRRTTPTFQVEKISPEALERYRTVGVRDGKKNFMVKTPPGKMGKKIQETTRKAKKEKNPPKGVEDIADARGKELTLQKLRAKVDSQTLKKVIQEKEEKINPNQAQKLQQEEMKKALLKKEIKAAEAGVPLTALRSQQAVQNFRRQENLRADMLRELSTQSSRADVLKRTGFNLHFEPPEGVNEDELNSVEKIFYGFQKRIFISYVNSFLSAYNDKVLQHPQIQNVLRNERHLLTGKIDFDTEGNIMRIKILRSSTNDEVHDLFETTLRDIRTLPNPPKAIIKNKEFFTIYYQLRINN